MKKSFIVFTFISFVLFEMFMYLYGAIFQIMELEMTTMAIDILKIFK